MALSGPTELITLAGFLLGLNITLVGMIYKITIARLDTLTTEMRLLHECMDRRSQMSDAARAQMAENVAALRSDVTNLSAWAERVSARINLL